MKQTIIIITLEKAKDFVMTFEDPTIAVTNDNHENE